MTNPQEIATFIQWYRAEHLGRFASVYGNGPVWTAGQPTAEQLAEHFVTLAEFQLLNLGTLLGSPDGELIAAGVGLVIPTAYALDYRLFVDGLRLAAGMQQTAGRKRAGAFALLIAAVVGIAVVTS